MMVENGLKICEWYSKSVFLERDGQKSTQNVNRFYHTVFQSDLSCGQRFKTKLSLKMKFKHGWRCSSGYCCENWSDSIAVFNGSNRHSSESNIFGCPQ